MMRSHHHCHNKISRFVYKSDSVKLLQSCLRVSCRSCRIYHPGLVLLPLPISPISPISPLYFPSQILHKSCTRRNSRVSTKQVLGHSSSHGGRKQSSNPRFRHRLTLAFRTKRGKQRYRKLIRATEERDRRKMFLIITRVGKLRTRWESQQEWRRRKRMEMREVVSQG